MLMCSDLQSTKAWILASFVPILCWILFSLSPFMNMHVPIVQPAQFCCLGRYCCRKNPWCSPYLLQEINHSFFHSLACLCLFCCFCFWVHHMACKILVLWLGIGPGSSAVNAKGPDHCDRKCVCDKSLQSCLPPFELIQWSPLGSSVHWVFQARILECKNKWTKEYWSGLPCPLLRDLSHPGIEPLSLMSPALADGFFTTSATWE